NIVIHPNQNQIHNFNNNINNINNINNNNNNNNNNISNNTNPNQFLENSLSKSWWRLDQKKLEKLIQSGKNPHNYKYNIKFGNKNYINEENKNKQIISVNTNKKQTQNNI